ncbi:MAG: type IV toxin-antitoxin system AbiEi family antitoxin domain-containing protein [Chlamydiota bacterium]|jgi:predicted transcriptional regulator of viral defense system
MKKKSKYYQPLRKLLKKPQFSAKQAEEIGVPRHILAYLCKKGILERISRGVYRSRSYEPKVDIAWEQLAINSSTIPQGVICLISALAYYDLTDEIPRENWIAVPHQLRAPKRKGVRIIRMRNIELGKREIMMGEYKVKIFDKERCIIDAFRYLSLEIAIKALKAYLFDSKQHPSLTKLSKYAKILRVNIQPYIITLTT